MDKNGTYLFHFTYKIVSKFGLLAYTYGKLNLLTTELKQ